MGADVFVPDIQRQADVLWALFCARGRKNHGTQCRYSMVDNKRATCLGARYFQILCNPNGRG